MFGENLDKCTLSKSQYYFNPETETLFQDPVTGDVKATFSNMNFIEIDFQVQNIVGALFFSFI